MIWVCFKLVLCFFGGVGYGWLDFHIQFGEGIGGSAKKCGSRAQDLDVPETDP